MITFSRLAGLVIFMALTAQSQAQVYAEGKDINAMEDVSVCNLNVSSMPLSSGMLVLVDYGEGTSSKMGDRITTKDGGKVKIKSVVHAINYMESRGWTMFDYDVTDSDSGVEHHILFRKSRSSE